jgi:hypothetical protein
MTPSWTSPKKIKNNPLKRMMMFRLVRINLPTILLVAPKRENTIENPATKKTLDKNTRVLISLKFNPQSSLKVKPVMIEKYEGRSGSRQGEKKLVIPAK